MRRRQLKKLMKKIQAGGRGVTRKETLYIIKLNKRLDQKVNEHFHKLFEVIELRVEEDKDRVELLKEEKAPYIIVDAHGVEGFTENIQFRQGFAKRIQRGCQIMNVYYLKGDGQYKEEKMDLRMHISPA